MVKWKYKVSIVGQLSDLYHCDVCNSDFWVASNTMKKPKHNQICLTCYYENRKLKNRIKRLINKIKNLFKVKR